MNQAFICDGVRTPIGRGGALGPGARRRPRPPLRVLLERHPQVDWAQLDDVILGCANQAGEDNRNLARMALLLAGVPVGVSGTTVNRLCGSGLMRWRWRRAASKPVTPGCCWRAARNR